MGGIDPETVRSLVERSCNEQGVPVKVTSESVAKQVASLLGTSSPRRKAMSDSPDRVDSGRVEDVRLAPSGQDEDVIQDGLDDGALPIEVQRRPLAS